MIKILGKLMDYKTLYFYSVRVSTYLAYLASIAYIALVIVVVYGVITRYFLRMPDIRSFFVSYWLMGIGFLLVLPYTIHKESHIRVDLLYGKLSQQKKFIFGLIHTMVICIFFIAIIPTAMSWAYRAFIMNEADSSVVVFAPPIWWYRWVLVITLTLAVFQGIIEIVYRVRFQKETLKKT